MKDRRVSIKIGRETLKYLRMAQGVYQATTGRKYSYDKVIRDMAAGTVYSHAEIASEALKAKPPALRQRQAP